MIGAGDVTIGLQAFDREERNCVRYAYGDEGERFDDGGVRGGQGRTGDEGVED